MNSSFNPLYEIVMKTILRYITHQIEGLEIFTEGIKLGIIEESNKILSVYLNKNKILFENYSKLEQEMANEINSVINLRTEYMNKMKSFETIIVNYMANNPSTIEYDSNINEGIRSRNQLESNYVKQITKVAHLRNKYITESSGFLTKYKEIFDTIVDKYKKGFTSFKTILALKIANDKSIIQDIVQTIPLIDNSQLEFPNKLFDNISIDPMYFKPYQLSILTERKKHNSNVDYNNNVLVYNVVTFMKKHFLKIAENVSNIYISQLTLICIIV